MFERFIRDVALNPMVLRLDPSVFRCNNPSSHDFGAGHGRGGRGGSGAGSNTGMDETRMPEAGDLGHDFGGGGGGGRTLHVSGLSFDTRTETLEPAPVAAPVDKCGVGVYLVSGLMKDGKVVKPGIFIDSVVAGRGASAARASDGQHLVKLQKNDQIIQVGTVVVSSLEDATDALVGERGSEVVLLVQRLIRRGRRTDTTRFYITVTRS